MSAATTAVELRIGARVATMTPESLRFASVLQPTARAMQPPMSKPLINCLSNEGNKRVFISCNPMFLITVSALCSCSWRLEFANSIPYSPVLIQRASSHLPDQCPQYLPQNVRYIDSYTLVC